MSTLKANFYQKLNAAHLHIEEKLPFSAKRLLKAFAAFAYLAAGITAAFCLHEIFYGSGPMVHPVWDGSYNWIPLVSQLILISFVASFTYSASGKIAPKFMNITLGALLGKMLQPSLRSFKLVARQLTTWDMQSNKRTPVTT